MRRTSPGSVWHPASVPCLRQSCWRNPSVERSGPSPNSGIRSHRRMPAPLTRTVQPRRCSLDVQCSSFAAQYRSYDPCLRSGLNLCSSFAAMWEFVGYCGWFTASSRCYHGSSLNLLPRFARLGCPSYSRSACR